MKRSMIIFMAIAMSLGVMAQEKEKTRETGIIFSSMNHFGITYRTGSDNALWRFNSLVATGKDQLNEASSYEKQKMSAGFGISFGREYRRPVNDKLDFRIGADLTFDYSYSKTKQEYKIDSTMHSNNRELSIYSPGINMILGLNYSIDDHLIIGAELLPGIKYNTGKEKGNYRLPYDEAVEGDISGYSFGLTSNSVRLSLLYTWP